MATVTAVLGTTVAIRQNRPVVGPFTETWHVVLALTTMHSQGIANTMVDLANEYDVEEDAAREGRLLAARFGVPFERDIATFKALH